MSENALTPVEQKEVLFYDDQITAVRLTDNTIYVPVRPICDALGINWAGQRQRINRDPVLADELKPCVVVTHTQGQPDQRRDVMCLPLKFIPGWLFGINANRVKSELRDKIIRYQRECHDVLAEAFMEGRLTADASFDELLQSDSEAVEAYKMLQAMVKLARNQIMIEARLDAYDGRFSDHETRIETIEATLGDTDRAVTPDQASQISQAVKAVAIAQGKVSGRNEFGAVYGELYRKFGITSYKLLPANRFEEAMEFLSGWHQELTGDAPF